MILYPPIHKLNIVLPKKEETKREGEKGKIKGYLEASSTKVGPISRIGVLVGEY